MAAGRSALLIVLHHVVADGLAGLAVLSRLVDDAGSAAAHTPAAVPQHRLADAPRRAVARRRIGGPARLRAGAKELLRGGIRGAPACSLNARPVGPRRAIGVAQAELAPLVAVAKASGGTVNDVALTAVTGALGELLARRRERPDRLVVSIPVTARSRDEGAELGNRVGVLPVSLPLAGPPRRRLSTVAEIIRARKSDVPGASAALYGPFARALAAVGAFGWFIGRQRLVNTFVTDIRGPDEPLTFGGHRIAELIPVAPVSGNVGVGFAVCKHEGPEGAVVQFGGQTPLKLAAGLHAAGIPILGTGIEAIDLAEDRARFGALLDRLGYKAPPYATASSAEEALERAPGGRLPAAGPPQLRARRPRDGDRLQRRGPARTT